MGVETDLWAKYLASGSYEGKKPSFPIRFKDGLFTLTLETDASRHLKPEGGDWKSAYLQTRKNYLVGGAWTGWNEEGTKLENPIIKQPHIIYESCPAGHGTFLDAGEFTDLVNKTFWDKFKKAR